jgi:hypothetical protein
MRRPALILIVVLLALAGCGDSGETTTSAPADRGETFAEKVDRVRSAWKRSESCERPPGASRWGCSVGAYRCQAVVTGRGWSVSCARPGESLAFRVSPR